MLSISKKNSVLLSGLLFYLFAFSHFSLAQETKPSATIAYEKGLLPVHNYSSKAYKSAPQNWAIQQDKRGVIYIGNNEGILEYDGVSWRLIKVTNKTNVRSLCIDSKGRIFVGADGEIGFMEPDISGKMGYQSLLKHIDKKDLGFTDVWSSLSAKNGVYFQTEYKIFRWDGKKMKVWNAGVSFHRIFNVNDHLFVRQREIGLMEIINNELVTLKGGETFAEEGVYGMCPLEGISDDILICTKRKGLYILKQSQHGNSSGESNFTLESFKTQIDPFLEENISYHLLRSKSLYSIGTVTNGAVTIDTEGKLSGVLNKQTGLEDATIYSQMTDASDNLWLATSNGITKVNIHSPVTSFSDKNGLSGHVLDIVRHANTLYVATNHGVSLLHPGYLSNGTVFFPASFENIPSIKEECWDLLSFNYGKYSMLLGVSSENIFSIDKQLNTKEILRCKPWRIYQSKFDSARVFVGLENGMSSLYWNGNQWLEEAAIPELSESVHSITEDAQGNIWLGHTDGTIKISFKEAANAPRKLQKADSYSISKYDSINSGLPDGIIEIANVNGQILFGGADGVYTFADGKFTRQTSYGSEFSDVKRQIHRIAYEKNSRNIWLETHIEAKYKFEFGFLRKDRGNKFSWYTTPFLPYSDEIIHSIYHDDNGITWFGGSEGLYRYDAATDSHKNNSFNAIIRKVTIGRDSAIFNGTFFDSSNTASLTQNESFKTSLSFSDNSVNFEFSSLDFTNERALRYQYFLEGNDTRWSNWQQEPKANYTNLPEGKHVFHVKSKNIFNQESAEATFEFTILPPWYRTWWAYVLYVLASIGLIWGIVIYTSRGLKAIIRERTAEIVKQKEVIEYKNRNITDSINYAKRIQEAILPPKDLMRSRFPESFILYRPKDIVAGDFYWFAEKEGKFIVAACDCTGHGVPGAFMSLISYSLLNEVLLEKHFTNPGTALDTLKKGIIKSLGQTGQTGEQKDGMDMSLICLEVLIEDKKIINKLSFAGANNSLYLVRKGELIELTADKMPIGIYLGMDKPFTNKEMILESGDTIYLFSDGYADQFGGEKGKKFTKKRYKELLLAIQNQSMSKQGVTLEQSMDAWLGDQQLIDDVLVMGIRIS